MSLDCLFSEIQMEAALEAFLSGCHRRRLKPRTTFVHPGDPPDTLFYLISGSATVLMVDEEGRELILAYLSEGDFIGEIGLFHPVQAREVTIRTRGECEVAAISYQRLRDACQRELASHQGPLLYRIGLQLSGRVLQSSRKLSQMAYQDMATRIMEALRDLCQGPGAQPHALGTEFTISRQELSRLVGCSREMVSRVLKNLEERCMISVSGKTIIVYRGADGDGVAAD